MNIEIFKRKSNAGVVSFLVNGVVCKTKKDAISNVMELNPNLSGNAIEELIEKAQFETTDNAPKDPQMFINFCKKFFLLGKRGKYPLAMAWYNNPNHSKEIAIDEKFIDVYGKLDLVWKKELNEDFKKIYFCKEAYLPKKELLFAIFNNSLAPSFRTWMEMPTVETIIISILEEYLEPIDEVNIKLISWDKNELCRYNPIARGKIPVIGYTKEEGVILHNNRPEFPEAFNIFIKRLDADTRQAFMASIFGIFVPDKMRGRQVNWMRGKGNAGQSTTMNALVRYIGSEYATASETGMNNFGTSSIYDKIFVYIAEIAKENTAVFVKDTWKKIIGGDAIRVEDKGGKIFTIISRPKVFCSSNFWPTIDIEDLSHTSRHYPIRFNSMDENDLKNECVLDDNGNVTYTKFGAPNFKVGYEERLFEQMNDFLYYCAIYWNKLTNKGEVKDIEISSTAYSIIQNECLTEHQIVTEEVHKAFTPSIGDFITSNDMLNIIGAIKSKNKAFAHSIRTFAASLKKLDIWDDLVTGARDKSKHQNRIWLNIKVNEKYLKKNVKGDWSYFSDGVEYDDYETVSQEVDIFNEKNSDNRTDLISADPLSGVDHDPF